MVINDIKKEIKNLKKLTAEQVIESEKLKKSVIEAVNCFIRLETLYKIKCKELEVVKEQSSKETAEKILEYASSRIKSNCEQFNQSDLKKDEEKREIATWKIFEIGLKNFVKEHFGVEIKE